MNKLAIIGAGGHGKVAAEIAELSGWEEVIFFDNDPNKEYRWHIQGTIDDLLNDISQYDNVFIAIGNNTIRKDLFLKFKQYQCNFPSLIHPNSIISPSAKIEDGCLIAAGSIINADATLGIGSILNTKASLDHDCIIGEFTHIAPGTTVAGNVNIGHNCWLGIGSTVIQNITIADDIFIGANTLIIRNLIESGLYFGQPAQLQK